MASPWLGAQLVSTSILFAYAAKYVVLRGMEVSLAKKFYTEMLFKDHFEIALSYREIAQILSVSLSTAKRYIRLDISNGWINRYYSGHPSKLCTRNGKNYYELTSIGERRVLMKWSCFYPQSYS